MQTNSKRDLLKVSSSTTLTNFIEALHDMSEKFRGSNLRFALCEAINNGDLFIMPDGYCFSYCRGTGPISFNKLSLGPKDESITDRWSHLVIARFSVHTEHEDYGEKTQEVTIYLPEKLLKFHEISKGIPHAPQLTKMVFDYKPSELTTWIRDQKDKLYARTLESISDQIDVLEKYFNVVKKRKKPPHANGF